MLTNRRIPRRNKTGAGKISDNRQKHLSDFFFMSDKTSGCSAARKFPD